jgi:site-specific DNA recombinase
MSKPTRVVGYVRLSDASKEESTSIARQHEIIEQTSSARGYDLVCVEADEDVSASKKRLARPGLTRVRRMLASGDADAVLVWRLDRLARSVGDIATLLDEGVVPISCTEPFDASSSMGRAMVEISQVFAGLEARAISDRVTASIAYLKKAGRWAGGNTPYGYMSAPNPSGSGRILVPNPEEVAVVREAARRILEGETSYAIAKDFTHRDIRPRKKTSTGWIPKTIEGVLTGDAIVGRYTHHGELIRDDSGLPLQVWEPILDATTWHRLRDRLGAGQPKATRPAQRRRASRLLSGLIRCAECGYAMYVKNGGSNSCIVYFCASGYRGRKCVGVGISAQRLDDYMERRFLDAFGDSEVTIRIEETPASEVELADVEAAIRDTAAAMAEDQADVAALAEQLAALKTKRSQLRAAPAAPLARLIGTGEKIREVWERAELPQRRDLLKANIALLSIRKALRPGSKIPTGALVDEDRVLLAFQPPVSLEHQGAPDLRRAVVA